MKMKPVYLSLRREHKSFVVFTFWVFGFFVEEDRGRGTEESYLGPFGVGVVVSVV